MEDVKLLTLEQAADRLAMKTVTLRMWASAGKIRRLKIGRAVRIPASEIDRIIEQGIKAGLPQKPK